MTLCFLLICLMSRLYYCKVKLHLTSLWFLFFILWMKVRGLWSEKTSTGCTVVPKYTSKCSNAKIRTRHSLSIVESFLWCLTNFLEKYEIGWSIPSSPTCIRTPPYSMSLASMSNLNYLWKSGEIRAGSLISMALILLKPFSVSSDHSYLTFFANKYVNELTTWEKFWQNFP